MTTLEMAWRKPCGELRMLKKQDGKTKKPFRMACATSSNGFFE
jgi:hypothetical protein